MRWHLQNFYQMSHFLKVWSHNYSADQLQGIKRLCFTWICTSFQAYLQGISCAFAHVYSWQRLFKSVSVHLAWTQWPSDTGKNQIQRVSIRGGSGRSLVSKPWSLII